MRLRLPSRRCRLSGCKGEGKKTKTAAPTRTVVRLKFGPDVRAHMVAEFKRTRGMPQIPQLHQSQGLIAARVKTFLQTVSDVVPPGTAVSVWPAINMAETLAQLAPDQYGPDSGNDDTTDRGANMGVLRG